MKSAVNAVWILLILMLIHGTFKEGVQDERHENKVHQTERPVGECRDSEKTKSSKEGE